MFRWSKQGVSVKRSGPGVCANVHQDASESCRTIYKYVELSTLNVTLPEYLGYDPKDSRYGQAVNPVYAVICISKIINDFPAVEYNNHDMNIMTSRETAIHTRPTNVKRFIKYCYEAIVGLSETKNANDVYLNFDVANFFAELDIFDDMIKESITKPSIGSSIVTTPSGRYWGQDSSVAIGGSNNAFFDVFNLTQYWAEDLEIIDEENPKDCTAGRAISVGYNFIGWGSSPTGEALVEAVDIRSNGNYREEYVKDWYAYSNIYGSSRIILPMETRYNKYNHDGHYKPKRNTSLNLVECSNGVWKRFVITRGHREDWGPIGVPMSTTELLPGDVFKNDTYKDSPTWLKLVDVVGQEYQDNVFVYNIGRCWNWWVML